MALFEDLQGLQLLHHDLLAQAEQRLPNIDRLWMQLDARVEEFKRLLDKAPRNEQSRKSLESGKIIIDDDEYAINDDFKQGALMLADQLNLDELDAARLFFISQDDAEVLGRSVFECSIIRFHQVRKYILDCFRLILQLSSRAIDIDSDREPEEFEVQETIRSNFGLAVEKSVGGDASRANAHSYVAKCLQSMSDIKQWLKMLDERLNSATVLGQVQTGESQETYDFQKVSLIQQHECLGIIVQGLVKAKYASVDNFKTALQVLRRADKYDAFVIHLIPATGAFMNELGAHNGSGSIRQARELDRYIVDTRGENPWVMPHLHAAMTAWWIGEYSGWYGIDEDDSSDNLQTESPLLGVDLKAEKDARIAKFLGCLKDGAFEFLMSLAADVKSSVWQDPARHSLRDMLQTKVQGLSREAMPVEFSDFFQLGLMDELEVFIDSTIEHLPNTIRKLRLDELEQRQLSPNFEHDLDLERLLVLMSYTFEGRPESAALFWADPNSNFFGFLSWASGRASTPLNSAFCELLQAISPDEECASSAHKFLMEETAPHHRRERRNYALNWSQIFRDLGYYISKFHAQPAAHQASSLRFAKPAHDIDTEPDEKVMLESYLRLISKILGASTEARTFILQSNALHLVQTLFELAKSSIEPRLRGLAFATLKSVLIKKSDITSETVWRRLDEWICGAHLPTATMPSNALATQAPLSVTNGIFDEIAIGFEQPNAFVQLLTELMQPVNYELEDACLNDALPFPEDLGSSKRMPGAEPYIDFAIGQIFARKTQNGEISNPTNQRLLSLSCLQFIATCLGSFNEDLVIFANSNINVDPSIRASSLESYALLHPFVRTMEWMFNERVMNALFQSVHERIEAVGNAAPDSPLVLTLLCAIHVMNSIMDLQPTYIDIIRPLLKKQPAYTRNPVASTAFASFEDGVLNHLGVVVDLGLYCGSGHPDLALASLKLLQKFSTSPRLIAPAYSNVAGRRDRNKVIAALEKDGDADRISRSLISEFHAVIDMEEGPVSPGYLMKMHILDFSIACLRALPGKPSMAHLLLGFTCHSSSVEVAQGSTFSNEVSLFHAILKLAMECPVQNEQGAIASWLTSLKDKALQVLRYLWASPLTRDIVVLELRSQSFLPQMWINEVLVSTQTVWSGQAAYESRFGRVEIATDINDFLAQRAKMLQYVAEEMRSVGHSGSVSMRQQISGTLLGTTVAEDGSKIQNSTIFGMFDFMALDPFEDLYLSPPSFAEIDFSVCLTDHDGTEVYDIRRVEALLALREKELLSAGYFPSLEVEKEFERQSGNLVRHVINQNTIARYISTRLEAIEAWTQVMLMIVALGGLEETNKLRVILEAILIVQAKLEKYSFTSLPESQKLASLAKFLLFSIDFKAQSFKNDDIGYLANERLFQLFQVSLKAIQSPISDPHLREVLYGICYRYLTGMADMPQTSAKTRKNTSLAIKTAGERILQTISDDVHASEHTTRTSALLLLGEFIDIGRKENSKHTIESLMRINCTSLVVDSFTNVQAEIAELSGEDFDKYLSFVEAKLYLLLQISQTRFGATAVVSAGLFQAVRDSALFAIDPDYGIDAPDASIKKLFELLLAFMRVINCCVISRGSQNEQTMALARKFISDNRLNIMTIFKRSEMGTPNNTEIDECVDELAEAYTLLITISGFIDGDETATPTRSSARTFT